MPRQDAAHRVRILSREDEKTRDCRREDDDRNRAVRMSRISVATSNGASERRVSRGGALAIF